MTLASIQRITKLSPIDGADKIEVAEVLGWQVVVGKDANHKVGDLVIFYQIDSLLPELPEYEFLRKNCYVKNSVNGNGFRLKTIRLRGQISQGLIMSASISRPQSVFVDNPKMAFDAQRFIEGEDVTEFLGVKKYEKILSVTLAGIAKGNFPSFIPKTDAERIQNCYKKFDREWRDHSFEVTVKLDGTSATYYLKDGVFGVCSRNLDLEDGDNVYWNMAREHEIEGKLRGFGHNIAIQGEIIGPSIQGNKEGLIKPEFLVFNVWDIDEARYYGSYERVVFCRHLEMRQVPLLDIGIHKSKYFQLSDFLAAANGSSLNAEKREGIVYKSFDNPNIQFKVISNDWLLEYGE